MNYTNYNSSWAYLFYLIFRSIASLPFKRHNIQLFMNMLLYILLPLKPMKGVTHLIPGAFYIIRILPKFIFVYKLLTVHKVVFFHFTIVLTTSSFFISLLSSKTRTISPFLMSPAKTVWNSFKL